MTRPELLELHQVTCDKARATMEAKNRDYAGGGGDCFANFRGAEFIGVHPAKGILMRSMDKFKRIQAFIDTGTLAVKTESIDDAVQDVINYMILIKGMLAEDSKNTPPQS